MLTAPPRLASITSARCSAWRKASAIPCAGVGSLKCPASPSSTHPGPAACRRKPCQLPITLIGNWHGFLRQAAGPGGGLLGDARAEEHTSELQARGHPGSRL